MPPQRGFNLDERSRMTQRTGKGDPAPKGPRCSPQRDLDGQEASGPYQVC